MISNRHFTKITLGLLTLVLILCVLAMGYQEQIAVWTSGGSYHLEYPGVLFDTNEVLEVSIQMEQEKWMEMLQSASQEVYYECEVTIGGKAFSQVGIRPKGNTSLSSIARDPDNNRYSFKLEFDQFVEGQTCFGLDKLVLNNSYADSTNMKEALIYDMYRYLGVDAPLYNYAKIMVNGEYWGVYLALEAVEDSFLLRNYGLNGGYLYKPDGMNHKPAKNSDNQSNPGIGGFFRGGGANLNYSDDTLDSYSSIWDGAVTDSDDADHQRVVEALKNISQGKLIEKYMDVDNLLRYMAVHNFSVNEDSLSGHMAHNYYLYESNGRLNIIPWDYNLAFGGMSGGNATSMVNDPIDDPYGSTDFFDVFLENEDYKKLYHEYYTQLIDGYFDADVFKETYQRIRSQIDTLVESDPTKMYSYEEYLKGVSTLYDVVLLRKESVKGQLAGTIGATTQLQQNDSSTQIDASYINVKDMGQFMMGGR